MITEFLKHVDFIKGYEPGKQGTVSFWGKVGKSSPRWQHYCATWDGDEMWLRVNGQMRGDLSPPDITEVAEFWIASTVVDDGKFTHDGKPADLGSDGRKPLKRHWSIDWFFPRRPDVYLRMAS